MPVPPPGVTAKEEVEMWCGRKVTLAMLGAASNQVEDPAVAGPPTQENKTMP